MKDNEEIKAILKEQIKMDDGILSKEELVECIKQLPEDYEIMVSRQNNTAAHNVSIDDELLFTINNETLRGKIKEIRKGTFDFTDENGELIYKQSIIIDLEMLPI